MAPSTSIDSGEALPGGRLDDRRGVTTCGRDGRRDLARQASWAPCHLGPDAVFGRLRNSSRRVRRRTSDLGDLPGPGCAADIGEAIAVCVIAVVVPLFLVLVGIPFLVALGELLLVLLLAAGGAVGRLLFRRAWTLDACGLRPRAPRMVGGRWSVVSRRVAQERRSPSVYRRSHRSDRQYLSSRIAELVLHLDDLSVSVGDEPPQGLEAAFDIAAAVLVQVAVRRNGPCETPAFPRPTRTSPLSDTRTLKQSLLKPRGWVLQALSVPRRYSSRVPDTRR